jgi:hypothetical protein
VRERYCTTRVLATPLATRFGDPPEFDPNRTRVVEVEMTRRDRAMVVTMEMDETDYFEPDIATSRMSNIGTNTACT